MITRFRAWHKTWEEMGKVKRIRFGDDGNVTTVLFKDETLGANLKIDEIELMQSTGLLDKNEQEIFEGDILKDGSEYGRAVYDPDRTMWRVYGKDFDDALSDWWTGRVVGNIYENPELLEADHDRD